MTWWKRFCGWKEYRINFVDLSKSAVVEVPPGHTLTILEDSRDPDPRNRVKIRPLGY